MPTMLEAISAVEGAIQAAMLPLAQIGVAVLLVLAAGKVYRWVARATLS